MKILIVSQYFWPENFKINDLALGLKSGGHKITVLTGIPNYPGGKFFNGYGFFKNRKEYFKGIEIIRAPIFSRGNGSGIRLALNYFSFVVGSILVSKSIIKRKFDLIFVFEVSPITVCLPAIFIKKFTKIPICLWVLDLWPESITAASKFKSNFLPRIITPLVKYIYNKTDKILVSSKGFISSITDKGVELNKIEYFPQWAESLYFTKNKYSEGLIHSKKNDKFKIVFAGNIGQAQDFPSILKAANILKNENIEWIIIGSGRKESWVKNKINEDKLNHCVHMMGRYEIEKMPYFFSNSDCLFLSLKRNKIFSLTIPGKVQAYLASGKPIIAMIDGEAAKVINESGAGFVCESENPQALADIIRKLMTCSKEKLDEFGKNGINYYNNQFKREVLFKKIQNIFEELISNNDVND